MKDFTWDEVYNFLGIKKSDKLKYKIPHKISTSGRRRFLYTANRLSDFIDYKKKVKTQKMSHCTGKNGWQQLARTIIAFAVVEANTPLATSGTVPKEASLSARQFLSGKNWYTDILEELAEWPDFFKAYKTHEAIR